MALYAGDIKQLLYKEFKNMGEFTSDPTTIVINELDICFGVNRVDVVVVNDKLHAFEIKSEKDNLSRLPLQMEMYNRVFDTITVVAHESHIKKLVKIIPLWWGLFSVKRSLDGNVVLEKIKDGKQNEGVDSLFLARLLWKNEMLELLGNKVSKNKTRHNLSKIIAQRVDKEVLKQFVIEKLKLRSDWKAVLLTSIEG